MYIRKTFETSWLFGLLKFSVTSEDRENGEYKHMISLRLFGKSMLNIVYRTGNGRSAMGFFSRCGKEHSFLEGVYTKTIKKSVTPMFNNTKYEFKDKKGKFRQELVVDDEANDKIYYLELKEKSDKSKTKKQKKAI